MNKVNNKIDKIKNKKYIIPIIIIIIICILSFIIYFFYNRIDKTNEGFYTTQSPIPAVGLGSPGMAPWLVCNMTSEPAKTWAPNTKWIGGNANWTTPIIPINKKYYFQKKFTINNINNLASAEMFITSDTYCIAILNNLQISPSNIVNGLETGMSGGFNNSGTPNNTVANKITIGKDKFKQGVNELLCSIFKNPNVNPAGLLANLILTYNDNTKVTIKTDSSWAYSEIYRPQLDPLPNPIKVKSIKLINIYANYSTTGSNPLQISQLAVYSMIDGVETNITQLSGISTVTASPNYPYPSNPSVISRTAQSAIDGNLKAKNFTIENGYHSTGNNDFWNLELSSEYDIHKIVYYNRGDGTSFDRAQGVEVQVFNSSSATPVYIYTLNSDLVQTIQIANRPPFVTVAPAAPVAPVVTVSPVVTAEPVGPVAPSSPVATIAPASPGESVGPVSPGGPVSPVVPVGTVPTIAPVPTVAPAITQYTSKITYLSDTVKKSNNNINTLRFTALDNQDRLNNIVKRMDKIKKDLVNTPNNNNNNNKTKNNFVFY